jgi:hypothetical protein
LLAVHPANFDTKHLECKMMDFRSHRDATLLEGTFSSSNLPFTSLTSQSTLRGRLRVCCGSSNIYRCVPPFYQKFIRRLGVGRHRSRGGEREHMPPRLRTQ